MGITAHNQETHAMNINIFRQQTIGGVVLAASLATMVAVSLSRLAFADDPPAPKADDFSPYVTKDGGISLPLEYREKFLHLGTWAVATKPGKPVDEMHNVYARPEDIQAYCRDGKFPDGAVLVKDVTKVGSDKLTTGQATWTTDIKIWFVMIKDAKRRFPKNDLWGDGWGWALYEAKDPKRNVATDYKTDCKVCHIPAKKDDWVYTRGYPVLAKPRPPK
jgi:cytochrome c